MTLEGGPKRAAFSASMSLKDSVFGLVVLYIAGVFASLFTGALPSWGHAAFAAGAALVGVPVVVAHLRARGLAAAAWCRMSRPSSALVLVLVGPLLWQAAVVSVAAWTSGDGLAARTEAGPFAQSLAAVVLFSVAEEIAFRVLLLAQFLAWGWSPLGAAAAQAVLFGLCHSTAGPYAATLIGLCGLAYALITMRAGVVWPAVVLHAGWNLIELTVHVLSGHAPRVVGSPQIPADQLLPHAAAVAGLVACSAWFWHREQRHSPSPSAGAASAPLTRAD